MAKAKVLADRISITSEVLTDENIRKVQALAPSVLVLHDETEGEIYRVDLTDEAAFATANRYGSVFKEGTSLATYRDYSDEEAMKLFIVDILHKINAIEKAVEEFLESNPFDDIENSIEFM